MTYDAIGRVLTRIDPVSGTTSFTYSPGGTRTVASNATFKDSTNVWYYCKVGTYAISYGCNADTTVVTMLAAPSKQYTMGYVTPGRFDQSATASDADGNAFRRFTRNTLGLRDSVMLDPLTMKYVFDSYDGLRTTTSLPNTSTRTDQYTANNESFSWSYTDTTANPLYRRSEQLDSLGQVSGGDGLCSLLSLAPQPSPRGFR